MENVRICKQCGQIKKVDQFRKQLNKNNKEYFHPYCRSCEIIRTKKYFKSHPEWAKKVYKRSYEKWKRKMAGTCCEICGEGRVLDVAHINPRLSRARLRTKWWNEPWNTLGLCPNHHRLFDQGKLSKEEYEKINKKVEYAKVQYNNTRHV